jgi:hypothetical protein
MIGRTPISCRLTRVSASVLAVLVCAAGALAASAGPASAAEACPNETLRQESNINSTTGQPYSAGLPECRAYEMVSPPYKQAHDAHLLGEGGIPVAPDGDVAGFESEGAFSEPENYRVNGEPENIYLSQRGASGWITSSAFAPRSLIDTPFLEGLDGDSSVDLRSVRVSCGLNPMGKGEGPGKGEAIVCALREPDGSWVSTPAYTNATNVSIGNAGRLGYLGGSSDLSRLFIQPALPLLPTDVIPGGTGAAGIYEVAGMGTASPELRLVNVDNEGHELVFLNPAEEVSRGGRELAPLLGDRLANPLIKGSAYHAIAESGKTVFFTATTVSGERPAVYAQAVYARIHCEPGPPSCKEDGNSEWLETVEVSSPSLSECSECPHQPVPKPRAATFQGASADGSKVFFTTRQKLLSKEPEVIGQEGTTPNLYEYDFSKRAEGKALVLLSPDPAGAKVEGVVRTSPDGSHVYFGALGALPSVPNTTINGKGEPVNEVAHAGKVNLYGYDTVTRETKFVGGSQVEGIGTKVSTDFPPANGRPAQTTPDGRYLVFSSRSPLAGDTNGAAQAVYRYDFQTGELTWVSQAAHGFTPTNEGKDAMVAPLNGTFIGAMANIGDWNRAISEDGSHIIFTTAEKLQGNDVNNAVDVYEWHDGTVSLISDGQNPVGLGGTGGNFIAGGMSASGSDIFFSTQASLVGQDTDVLKDIYDARVDGGFPAPVAPPSCLGEACQGISSGLPSFGSATSSGFPASGNLTPPAISVATFRQSKPKPLTRSQQLARALRACKGKPKKKRAACKSQARKKYGSKAKAKKTAKAQMGDRGGK